MKKKRLQWITVLLLICVFLAGCGIHFHVYTDRELEQVAEKLLEEKYGEEFVVYHTWSRSSTTFFADCAPANDTEIVFELIAEKNGDALLADGYVLGILEQQIKDVLQPEVQEFFSEAYQRATFMSYTQVPQFDQPLQITLEQYINTAEPDFVVYEVYVDASKMSSTMYEAEYELFSQHISDKIMNGMIPDLHINIYFVDTEMLDECEDYYSTVYNIKGNFAEKLDRYLDINIWYDNGIINMTYNQYKEQREKVNENAM